MKIEWLGSYAVGDPLIDSHHQTMFDLANAMLKATDQKSLRLCAMQLYQHVREHFAEEEALMRKVHFPAYKEHVAAHNQMLMDLGVLSDQIGKNQAQPEAVRDLLMDWALHHIPKSDAKLAGYLSKT